MNYNKRTAEDVDAFKGDSPRNDKYLRTSAITACIDLAGHVANGGEVTDEIRSVMKRIMPAVPLG